MSIRSDIDTYGRRLGHELPDDAQASMRRLTEVLEKLARTVEDLETRVRRLEQSR